MESGGYIRKGDRTPLRYAIEWKAVLLTIKKQLRTTANISNAMKNR